MAHDNRQQFLGVWFGLIFVLLVSYVATRREARTALRAGWDTGYSAPMLQAALAGDPSLPASGWMRIRGVPGPAASQRERVATREASRELRARGVRSLVFFSAAKYPWPSGVRKLPTGQGTLPVDLRDAYARGFWLGSTYGRFVDAWEVDNEPELIYVRDNPENYAAYLKAMYLGLRRGALESLYRLKGDGEESVFREIYGTHANRRSGLSGWRAVAPSSLGDESEVSSEPQAHSSISTERGARRPLVVMAPLAFPPGTHFEQLLENDLLSYTDGFNFHYYGYAQDFTGVYRRFEAAVREFSDNRVQLPDTNFHAQDIRPGAASARETGLRRLSLVRRQLPIFVSEYGYGVLSEKAEKTVEGRVRQWASFRSLAEQMQNLGIEAPMAFYLRPYLEDKAREFGLLMRPNPALGPERKDDATFMAGGVVFRPADFGVAEPEPWMRDIGRKIGEGEASPALAWLLHLPPIERRRNWSVQVPPPSPVVLDLVAGEGLLTSKTSRGHFLTNRIAQGWSGRGKVRVYNFHGRQVSGIVRITGATRSTDWPVTLAPGQMTELEMEFALDGDRFRAERWNAEFLDRENQLPVARLNWLLYPHTIGFQTRLFAGFDYPAEAARENAAVIDARPRAVGEETVQSRGRWRMTKGVQLEEGPTGTWRFTVTGFPDEPMQRALAELPLPDGFRFPKYSFLSAEMRLLPRKASEVTPAEEPRAEPDFSDLDREVFALTVRTRKGGIYATAFHFPLSTQGLAFTQIANNFTAIFYGRMDLPWRFLDNEPASLLFSFRPRLLPATYEISNLRVVELVPADRPTDSR